MPPLRRPSATTMGYLSSTPNPSSTRVHKSSDSHHTFNGHAHQSHSTLPPASSPTPLQKTVQVLVNRLKNKLPCHSGLSLDVIEGDGAMSQAVEALVDLAYDSLDIIAWALSELLERLAKPTDINGHWSIEVLQSQLFVLKILSLAMASRWHHQPRSSSSASNRIESPSPVPTGSAKKKRQGASTQSTTPPPRSEPPPLDDNCARYVLSVMVLFLRQTTPMDCRLMPSNRPAGNSYHDFESLDLPMSLPDFSPDDMSHSTDTTRAPSRNHPSSSSLYSAKLSVRTTFPLLTHDYEKTPVTLIRSSLSLNSLIARFVGRIVYHLSASNWNVVFHRLRTKIHYLASATEDNPDIIDITLIHHSALDRSRLVQVLNELSSLLVNMRQGVQLATAIPLRLAIWNWIEAFPNEFNDSLRFRGRLDGSPERVFDILHTLNQPGVEKELWPTLTILHCITPERQTADFPLTQFGYSNAPGQKSSRKEHRFVEEVLRHANTPAKTSDTAFICTLDICRAASFIPPDTESPSRAIASEIAHEIRSALWVTHAQKPFWDSGDEIDVAMYSEALVTVYRFLPNEESLPLFTTCLESDRSEAVKICAVKACLTLTLESCHLPLQRNLEPLEATVAHRLRSIFKTTALRRGEPDQYGNTKRSASRPKAKRLISETLSDREALLLGILSLWRARVAFFLHALKEGEVEEWINSVVKLWELHVDISIKIATANSFQQMAELSFRMRPTDPWFDVILAWMKWALSTTLISVVTNLIAARADLEGQRLWIATALQILELFTRKTDVSHVQEIQLAPARLHAFTLAEIAFVVSLSSADSGVSQSASKGLRILAETDRQPGAPLPSLADQDDRKNRNAVYEELGDPNVMIVGRVGHQKRIRKLIRAIARPSAIHVAIWEECFWRWRSLSEVLIDGRPEILDSRNSRYPIPLSLEDTHFHWRNLTLFLAAYGDACALDDLNWPPLTTIVPAQYLPDAMRALPNPSPLTAAFIEDLTNLLVSETVEIRDVVRDALGYELSSGLYSRLLKHLDEVIYKITQGAGLELTDSYILFLDQFLAVLKLLLEKVQAPLQDSLSTDVGSTLFALACFISRFNTPACYRIKSKFCLLCDLVCEKATSLTFRKDNAARHDILDIVMEWIQEPSLSPDVDIGRVHNELNISCLRSAVKLLERLQLTPLSESDGNTRHGVSRLFVRYSGILLRGLDVCQMEFPTSDTASETVVSQNKLRVSQRMAELRDLVVTGLSHLVRANPLSGFKQCLHLAYDVDSQKRVIFAHVFARVLGQGTRFDFQNNSPAALRQARLRELVKGSDMVVVMAMCEVCPPAEVDAMNSVLLNLFDTRASLMGLLKLMIDREIAHAENDASLFRGNSACTKFLSAFAKIHGYNYLRSLIIPLVKNMSAMPRGHAYDLDPTKVSEQDLQANQRSVELVASSFLDIVSSSVPALPSMFREICAHIAKSVQAVWPKAKFAALGAFIFLRFISPAIVSPEIVDVEIPKDDAVVIRRGLMVIAKIIQNLANNIFFGKELHMVVLNSFLEDNIVNVTRFLSEVNKYSTGGPDEDEDEWLGTTADETDTIVLHRFLKKHADRIGKELLRYCRPATDTSPAVNGKGAWDALCALLVDMGDPFSIPELSPLTRSEHTDYLELMSRYAHRNTDPVKDIFIEASSSRDQPAVFILCMSRIDVDALDIDLLMFHIFKTLTSPAYEDQPFEIILDCTSFTSVSEIPVQFLKFCTELIPSDIRKRLLTTYILNANSLAQKYLRKLNNISAGILFTGEICAFSSVADLTEHVSPSAVAPLVYATTLEQETCQIFRDVAMRQDHQMRMPVVLEVGVTHLRVTSVKAQSISPMFTCKSTEIITLTDVSDVYNVSTGHDPYEFIIRRSRQGITLYFSSPERETIIKTIREAKGKMKESTVSMAERSSRYMNVPASLIHIGMLNVGLGDDELRSAAYDLLCAVCVYLKFNKNPIVASKAGFIPGDPSAFVISLSEKLAEFAPELTIDFICEVCIGMELVGEKGGAKPGEKVTSKMSTAQRINCLQYLSPWVKNLARFPNPASPQYEHSGARLRDGVRVLSDLTIADPEIATTVHKYVWAEIGRLDSAVVNIILDELVRGATDGGIGTHRCESIARIISAMSSINVRGKLLSKLRRTLGKTCTKPSKRLADNVHWGEIATLVRLTLVAGNPSKQASHNQLYVPEIVHLVNLVAGTGDTLVRKSVYGIIMNLLQSLYVARAEDASGPELLQLLNDCTQPETLKLFGLVRSHATSEFTNFDPPTEKAYIDTQELLSKHLLRIMNVTAGSRGLLNVWRARWMSLVTSMAFQLSSAIQTRAFIVIGTLATSDVDDDLLYQMLVAFKMALSQANETNTLSVVSMLRCISKVVPALPDNSRYIGQVFWLAVALLQSSHIAFYIEATELLRTSLEYMEVRGVFRNTLMSTVLLDARNPLEEVACQLDQLLGLSFDASFSFSLAALIFKGIRHSGLKDAGEAVLRCLLRVTVKSGLRENGSSEGFREVLHPDALGYFIALLPVSTTPSAYRRLLQECDASPGVIAECMEECDPIPRVSLDFIGAHDAANALFLASLVGAILTTAQGDDAETQVLYNLLSDVAMIHPDIVSMAYDGLQDRVKDTFANSSNPAIIRAVSHIFRVVLQDPNRNLALRGSASTIGGSEEVASRPGRRHIMALEEWQLPGLASSFQFLALNRGHVTTMINWIPELVAKIIE